MNFTTHKHFNLVSSSWGSGQPQDIAALLDSVITDFYSNLDIGKIPTMPVLVLSTLTRNPPTSNPEIIKTGNLVLIYLSTQDLLWSQYSYQFSHELCHYVIDIDFPPKNGRFGWFEESLCELASLFTLNKMSITWQTNPPYASWTWYSASLKTYVDDLTSKSENTIAKRTNEWLAKNLTELYKDRYKRAENLIIAVKLLPFFTATPDLWKTIQFIKEIAITDDMTFELYLSEWKKLIPASLHLSFDDIIKLFTDNNIAT